jgi:hypothetical protein
MSDLPASQVLYDGIRTLILSARQTVARGVDLLQVHTNYEIGRRIVEQEQRGAERAQYGKEILTELAARLTAEFGKGFSRSNLEYMRRFYLVYPDRSSRIIPQTTSGKFPAFAYPSAFPIPQTASGKSSAPNESAQFPFTLSWSHYVFLLGLNDQERGFYEIEAAEQGWTLRELKRQFSSGLGFEAQWNGKPG